MVSQELLDRIKPIYNIGQVMELLHWDQQVMMPEDGIKARSQQISTLSRIRHQLLADEELSTIIEEESRKDQDERGKAVLREVGREHEKAKKVPMELIEKMSEKESEALDAWKKAREKDDFDQFAPHLEEMVELKREYAAKIDPDEEPYKVLFRDYEPYLEFDRMDEILETLREELTDFLERIKQEGDDIETDAFEGSFEKDEQIELNKDIAEKLGYDRDRGRLDVSAHPFTSGNQFDCRITTRYNEEDIMEGILPTIHETGHALYQLGLPEEEYGTPLGEARDLSVHESQSRLWENHVGRSRPFQEFVLGVLEQRFPEKFEDVTVQECYESVNQVYERNPIRVNADELTYHLHIVLRYELERKLVNGEITVEELPGRWNDKMEELLGFRPENDAEGVLQDVHWSQGAIGYFPTYSLGSIMAAQVYEAASSEIEDLDKNMENGEFEPLLEWLRHNIHSYGKQLKTEQLIEKATGEKPNPEYFLDYIREKYSQIYGLE